MKNHRSIRHHDSAAQLGCRDRTISSIGLALAVTAALGAARPALAADSAAPDTSGQLEEITVTARYRSENLQQIPIAITALSGEQLEAHGFTNIVDLDKVAPNVTLQQSGASGGKTAVAYIRGVGQNDFTLSFEPGVGMYLDDVYFGTTFGAMFDLGDIDRVEILRGPQGTLFGMNSEGGAVRIFTTQPKGDNSGYLSVGYGSYNRTQVKGAFDFSIIPDTLTMRISSGMNTIDGYVTRYDFVCEHPTEAGNLPRLTSAANCKIGNEGGDTAETLRANVRWTPNENLEVRFSADALKDHRRSGGQQDARDRGGRGTGRLQQECADESGLGFLHCCPDRQSIRHQQPILDLFHVQGSEHRHHTRSRGQHRFVGREQYHRMEDPDRPAGQERAGLPGLLG
jgi:iron complex outermembrane receptor protein